MKLRLQLFCVISVLGLVLPAAELGSSSAAHAEFRVAAFGATGDGTTDDGPAIQRALEEAELMADCRITDPARLTRSALARLV